MPVAACLETVAIQRFREGRLSAQEMEELTAHLESCERCARLVQELPEDGLVGAVRAARQLPARQDETEIVEPLIQKLLLLRQGADTQTRPLDTVNGLEGSRRPAECDFLAPPQDKNELGRLGNYSVVKVLGQGGMGMVFQALDVHLKRPVALKVMLPRRAADPHARERFLREARAAAAVRHDHVVTIYQAGEAGTVAFLAMELLEGQSLEDRLRGQGILAVGEVLRIGREIAEGLAAAHERGLIHRDVKPANIWLEKSGRVKLLDFGLVCQLDGDGQLTSANAILGTPAYMSPEQANGDPVDARSDLFSLGCVLYRMATGESLFKGEGALQVLHAIMVRQPRQPSLMNPEIPGELSELIVQLLAKNPGSRPASAGDVVKRLRTVEDAVRTGTSAAPAGTSNAPTANPSSAGPARPAGRRRPLWVPWAVAAGLLLLAGGVWALCQISFSTPHGTFIVKIDSKDVEARFKNGQLLLLGPDGKIKYTLTPSEVNKTLRAGPYKIRVMGADGLTVDVPEFVMKDGDNVTVRVVLAPPVANEGPDPKKAGPDVKGLPPAEKTKFTEPLDPVALVSKPAALPGVTSWTIETIRPRGGVRRMQFDPSGARIAVSGEGLARIYDARTGRLERCLFGGPGNSWGNLAWSKDGKFLAWSDATLVIWDALSGKKLWAKEAEDNDQPAWSPDGKLLATGGRDVLLWDPRSGARVDRLKVDSTEPIASLSWSGDGKMLAGLNRIGDFWIWHVETATLRHRTKVQTRPRPHHNQVVLEWSPDNSQVILYAPSTSSVIFWDLKTEKEVRQVELFAAEDQIGGKLLFQWSDDGKTLRGILGRNGYWDAAAAKWTRPLQPMALLRIDPTLESPPPQAWSADGKIWATVPYRRYGGIKLWSIETARPMCEMNSNPFPAHTVVSPDGKIAAVATDDLRAAPSDDNAGVFALLDNNTGALLRSLRLEKGGEVGSLSWSPDSRRLFLGSIGGVSGTYDISAERLVFIGEHGDPGGVIGFPFRGGLLGRLRPSWSQDAKLLALPYAEGAVFLLDPATGKFLDGFQDKEFGAAVALAPNGDVMIVGHQKGPRLYDVAKKAWIKTEDGLDVRLLVWSPDGKSILSGGPESLAIWENASGKILGRLEKAGVPGDGKFSWSKDGKTICGRYEAKLRIVHWDATTGKVLGSEAAEPTPVSESPSQLRFVPLANDEFIAISPEGHFRSTPRAEREIVYIVQTDKGQETLTPTEMEKKYGWKNDPNKVHMAP